MIREIAIKKLFEIYDYNIMLHNDVSIIYGLNGCGKTTILRMLNYLFNIELKQLSEIEFESLILTFDDNSCLTVNRKQLNRGKSANKATFLGAAPETKKYLTFSLRSGGETYISPSTKREHSLVKYFLDSQNRINQGIHRVFIDGEEFERFDRFSEADKKIAYYDFYNFSEKYDDLFRIDNPQIAELLSSIKIHFIMADRLRVEEQKKTSSRGESSSVVEARIIKCANEISARISKTMENYGYFSQNNDRTFPFRVIREPKRFTLKEIEKELIELENRRKLYISIGILEPEQGITSVKELIPGITEENMIMLSQYIVDSKEKLGFLEELSGQISLLKELLEKKLASKEIVFEKERGFYFIQNQTGKVLDGTQLSSGEQQELIMLFDMIFNTTQQTLILIDEPELSLHIKWQLEFIDDLLEIIKARGFKAIIATHSPQIVDKRWDLAISLN